MQNFEVHSNESACRKSGSLRLEQVAINNNKHALVETYVQLLKENIKYTTTSAIKITLSRLLPSPLTTLEEHIAFFEQDRPIIDPAIHHHEVFYATTPVEPTNVF